MRANGPRGYYKFDGLKLFDSIAVGWLGKLGAWLDMRSFRLKHASAQAPFVAEV